MAYVSKRKTEQAALEAKVAAWNTPKRKAAFILKQTWKPLFVVLVPILFLPIFLWKPKQEKAPHGLYTIAVMASYWISECLPLPVTSLLPVVLLPLFGITSSEDISSKYFNNTIMFLFGGCVVALSFEYSNLHTRISFFVMKSIGAQASVLLLGMMLTCMVLSCWMNNTSTTAMMVPCITVIMDQYRKKMIPVGSPEELAAKFGNPFDDSIEDDAPSTPKKDSPKDLQTAGTSEDGPKEADPAPAESTEVPIDIEEKDLEIREERKSAASSILGPSPTSYWYSLIEEKKKYLKQLEIMFMLGVAFSSNIGGTGVITGTGTNLIALSSLRTARANLKKAILQQGSSVQIKKPDECVSNNDLWELDFMKWIVLNVLPMLVNVLICWAFLAAFYQGIPHSIKSLWKTKVRKQPLTKRDLQDEAERREVAVSIRSAITDKYEHLGKITLHEILVFSFFFILVIFWLFKNPMFLLPKPVPFQRGTDGLDNDTLKLVHPRCHTEKAPKLKLYSTWGWARFFGDKCDDNFVHDTAITILICLCLFIIPKDPVYYKNILRGGLGEGIDDPIIPFSYCAENIPWGPFLLLGGGFGISQAITDSGLKEVLSSTLKGSQTLKDMNSSVLILVVLCGVAILTSLASNTATAAIVSPVLIELAQTKGFPPLYLLLPPIVGASYAFVLPISTPPNSIVYDKAQMRQIDMFKSGIWITLITNGILFFFSITWMKWILDVDTYDGACDIGPPETPVDAAAVRYLLIEETVVDYA